MGAPDTRRRGGWHRVLPAVVLAVACRSAGPVPPATPPPATPPEPTQAPEAGPAAATPAEPAASGPPAPGLPAEIVIERGEGAGETEPPPSLYEASVKARAERAAQPQRATRVVTDATLRQQAARGEITEAEAPPPSGEEAAAGSPPGAAVDEPAGSAEAAPAPPAEDPEIYWRQRTRDARMRWRAAAERIGELEEAAAQYRWDFYATDDPFYRDAEIKPAWDRTLAELEAAREEAEFERQRLQLVLDEGRRAGALPGWLREGLELEPSPDDLERGSLPEHSVAEPVEAEDPEEDRR